MYAEIRAVMRTQSELSVERMCQLAGVGRAGFYRQGGAEVETEQMQLRDTIQREALANRFYGYRRITEVLQRQGWAVTVKMVRRLMREDNLLAATRRRFVVTSDSGHPFRIYPNLARHTILTDVDQLWVADITYIRLDREFAFLAVVLDAFSRRVVGWALADGLDRRLTLAALERAIQSRQPPAGLVHHSDRGVQYASNEYVARLEQSGAVLSMSRPGCPWENGMCESWIKTLKKEEIDARPYGSREELQTHLEEFIEAVYNRVRLHSALGYLSPEEFESEQARLRAAGASGGRWLPAALSFPRHEEIFPDAS